MFDADTVPSTEHENLWFHQKLGRAFLYAAKELDGRDVRLNNVSQLAGFAKRDDLRFFAHELCGIEYEHNLALAPTQQMLADYRNNHGEWDAYAARFQELMAPRRIEEMDRDQLAGACLLCSEDKPHHCHRRLIAEYLRDKRRDVEIVHLWAYGRSLGSAFPQRELALAISRNKHRVRRCQPGAGGA